MRPSLKWCAQVRLLAMFDMAFSLMHAVADMCASPHVEGLGPAPTARTLALKPLPLASRWPAAIAAIMSYCGYLGARTFRRDLSRVYLVYLVLFALFRVALSVRPPSPASP